MEFLDKEKKMKVTSNINTSKELSPRTKRSKGYEFELHGELKKIRPHTFDDELEEGT